MTINFMEHTIGVVKRKHAVMHMRTTVLDQPAQRRSTLKAFADRSQNN